MNSDAIYDLNEIKNRLEPVFNANGVKSAILFGSYAEGHATPNSDVDILVDKRLAWIRFCGAGGICARGLAKGRGFARYALCNTRLANKACGYGYWGADLWVKHLEENNMGEIWVVVKSLVVFNRRVLIIKRSNYSIGAGEWDIPGGSIRFGEDLQECLHREIMEETGLTIRVDRLLYAMTSLISQSRQIVILTYLSHADTDAVILSHEHTDFLWATKSQLKERLSKPTLDDYTRNSVFDRLDIDD